MNIPAELWSEVSALFDNAMALTGADRGPWLDRLQASRPDVAIHVRRLIEAHERPIDDDPLSGPSSELVAAALAGQDARLPPLAAGLMLGPYRLLEPLGEGGMASVWLAEQTLNVVRRVALKIPHVGLEDCVATAERFAHERDLLAGLEHPHIARLYDAGVTADGRPYLAMEWIDGLPITRYADEHRLGIAQRIGLFLQVLRAVRHAHARLVIHRDIKPSNIIVTPDGQVKLLDFGIARLLADAFGDDADPPPGPGRALTPEAASPEQLAGEALATSSDVYSLGVVLYELLTGQRPYRLRIDASARDAAALHAALIATQVMAPSLLEIDAASAALRGATPRKLRRALSGDLDAILAKALMKQAAERYDSAEAMAADLERHLRFEPVQATHGGWAYVVGRALRRHRTVAAATGAVVLAIAIGVGGVAWQARVARQEAERATAVKEFLLQVFKASDPRIAANKPRGQATARELLDVGAERVERDFRDTPQLQLELLGLLANIYGELDEDKPYETMQARRLALARQYPGRFVDTEVDVLLDRASDDIIALDRARASQHLAEADRLLVKAGLNDTVQRAQWWVFYGDAMAPAKLAEREQAFRKAIALYDKAGPHDPFRPTALGRVGAMHFQRGDYAEAALWFQRSIEARKDCTERNDAEAQIDWGNLGAALANLGRNEEAARAYEQSSALGLKTYGERYQIYWWSESQRAKLLSQQGRRDEAEQIFQRLLTLAPYPPTVGGGWAPFKNYAATLAAEGDAARGLRWAEDAERFDEKTPYESTSLRSDRLVLGDIDEQLGRVDEARHMLQAAFDEFVSIEPADRRSRLAATERWARFLLGQHEIDAARRLFSEVLAQDHGRGLAPAALAQAGLARVALAEGQASAAREAGTAAVQRWAAVRDFRDVRMGVYINRVLAQALLAAGDREGAGAAAAKALADSQRYDAPSAASISEARTLQQQALPAATPSR